MPVYLVHGFRWPREGFSGIRVHAIVHNLDDCSAEYIQNDNSREEILGSFRSLYGDLMKEIEVNGRSLEFVEQYDPEDVDGSHVVSQPHAFVADKVVELAGHSIIPPAVEEQKGKPASTASLLSVNIDEVVANGPGLTTKAWEALADLRDKIAAGEKIGWWVVYNGDPERAYDEDEEDDEGEEEEEGSTPTAEIVPSVATTSARGITSERESTGTDGTYTGPPVPPKSTTSEKPFFGSRMLPTRSKQEVTKPEVVLPHPKDEKIPEPPKLKDVAKTSGFRKKFFGKKI